VSAKKPPPWWKTYPREYWTEAERVAAIKDGWRPPGAERQSVLEEQRMRVNQHLPWAPPLFTGAGMESAERYEERQRRRRVDALLKKHDIGQSSAPWWRI
jgi:hypothetical protein